MTIQIKSIAFFVAFLFLFCLSPYAQDSVADNMVLYQRIIGGWPKHIGNENINYSKTLTPGERANAIETASQNDATIDNNATSKEIRYLLKAYKQTGNKVYLSAAEKGIAYLLLMQNGKGGWPQYFPDSSLYRSQITFNDNAMINAMNVLWDVAHRTNDFDVVDTSLIPLSAKAVQKGIECILRTQVRVQGKPGGWAAQYDKNSLQPARARSYELVSLASSETVGIVQFLLKVEHPSAAVKAAIRNAVQWLGQVRVDGYKYVNINDATQPDGKDRVLVADKNSVVWARFYDIETNKPMFSGRDGIRKWSVAEIEHERRTGYGWYGTWPQKLLEQDYPEWEKKIQAEK